MELLAIVFRNCNRIFILLAIILPISLGYHAMLSKVFKTSSLLRKRISYNSWNCLAARRSNIPSQSSGLKTLVIVESPAKARTIQNFLKDISDDYVVDYSAGHIREISSPKDMAKSNKNSVVQPELNIKTSDLGVDVFDGFTPFYSHIRSKSEIIDRLKSKAKEVDRILLATDEDREGEAISWHLIDALKPTVPYQVRIQIDLKTCNDQLNNELLMMGRELFFMKLRRRR